MIDEKIIILYNLMYKIKLSELNYIFTGYYLPCTNNDFMTIYEKGRTQNLQ